MEEISRSELGILESGAVASQTTEAYEAGIVQGLEIAAIICKRNEGQFLSPEYATGQPLSSLSERFACKEIEKDIHAEIARLSEPPK